MFDRNERGIVSMNSVTIYTSSECEYCHEAKAFFKENNIQFTEYNISKDKEARMDIMKRGYRSVPVIMLGDKVIIGFDRAEMSELLGLRK